MKILLIDTTTKDLILKIITDDGIYDGSIAELGTKHSETLCLAVQMLLDKTGLTLSDMSAYACGIGPGSFTGIRIGVSTVKGYVVACPKPLIELNNLQAISVSDNCCNVGSAVIDAGNGYYFADYVNNVSPCLIGYDDEVAERCHKVSSAVEYADGLVKLALSKYNNKDFSSTLTPLYIRKSQAEEHK